MEFQAVHILMQNDTPYSVHRSESGALEARLAYAAAHRWEDTSRHDGQVTRQYTTPEGHIVYMGIIEVELEK